MSLHIGDVAETGASDAARLMGHVQTLFPLCRSITGAGLRQTLEYINEWIPLDRHEVPSGTKVLDWEIGPEWTVRGATIHTLDGRKIVDFAEHNLHLLQYSRPIDAVVSRAELDAHLFSLPDQPELIPYRTSYYAENWGFCLAHRVREAMQDTAYRVHIDTDLRPGSLSFGECLLPGRSAQEVLFSIHCCHPSLANDNLSAIAVAIELARELMARPRQFTYRFVFIPGTIGAIAWLAANRDAAARVHHGLVLSCLGDAAPPTYKRSRRGDALIDRYVAYILAHEGRVVPFSPYGYDERQYCSPGFNLPVGCLMRSPPGSFAQYHTSADNLAFVQGAVLADSLQLLRRVVAMIETDAVWCNTLPYGEPQLGRRGLYDSVGGGAAAADRMALLWVLNRADGAHRLLDIAELSAMPYNEILVAAQALAAAGLLRRDAE